IAPATRSVVPSPLTSPAAMARMSRSGTVPTTVPTGLPSFQRYCFTVTGRGAARPLAFDAPSRHGPHEPIGDRPDDGAHGLAVLPAILLHGDGPHERVAWPDPALPRDVQLGYAVAVDVGRENLLGMRVAR